MSKKRPKSSRKKKIATINNYTLKKTEKKDPSSPKKKKIMLKKVDRLRKILFKDRPEKIEIPPDATVVNDIPTEELYKLIQEKARDIYDQILKTGKPVIKTPKRSATNILWDEETDLLFLGSEEVERRFHHATSAKELTVEIRMLELIHSLLEANLHATKRECFYMDVDLFKEQKTSDNALEEVAAYLGCTRNSTHVVAAAKGAVIGRITFREDGDLIDCTRMGTGGKAITPLLGNITDIDSDGEFVLVIEKDAAFLRLAEERWYNKFPSILVTAKGVPDVATRMFVHRIIKELRLPAFSLVDSDPWGHYIHSIYLRGSKQLSLETPFLATPELRLIGVLNRDLDTYDIPKNVRLKMTEQDRKRAKQMLKEPFVHKNKKWAKDLRDMLKSGEKAEIQSLASHSLTYLTETYLPHKLETGDWI